MADESASQLILILLLFIGPFLSISEMRCEKFMLRFRAHAWDCWRQPLNRIHLDWSAYVLRARRSRRWRVARARAERGPQQVSERRDELAIVREVLATRAAARIPSRRIQP